MQAMRVLMSWAPCGPLKNFKNIPEWVKVTHAVQVTCAKWFRDPCCIGDPREEIPAYGPIDTPLVPSGTVADKLHEQITMDKMFYIVCTML